MVNYLNHLAYNCLPGKSPTVVFLSGFKSDMEGAKALFLESVCREIGHAFIRFDYSGHGKSEGKFEDGTIGQWKNDALKIIDELTEGPLILIGSSMGGWIMLLAALARPERIKALIGIAAAPDFTEDLMWNALDKEQRAELKTTGKVMIADCYGNAPYPITKNLIEEARNHLLLKSPIDITCPVRLLQGMKDEDVPYQTASQIKERLKSNDVEITLVEGATHRMSEPENLELLKSTLMAIIDK